MKLTISFIIIFIFGLIGIMFFSTVVHEYSHMKDFRDLNISLENETITMTIPLDWKIYNVEGHYITYIKQSDDEKAQEALKYTEIKAHILSVGLIALYLICFMYILNKVGELNETITPNK